ncbi:MAG TPA: HEAT repeat domain-containing protein [Rectinemataceae bacterium]|nr:HEAT repeat domain-containing protein [Rectinemataceae bacterium]
MRRTIRFQAIAASLVLYALALAPASAQARIQVVDSPLNRELVKIFPEIANGYIDLNGNGKLDQTADLNEVIPESRIRDGQLQAQEILDFIVANWRFIGVDKLKAVRQAVKNASDPLGQLIAIDFSTALDEAVRQREEMGNTLYLTPSALKEAQGRLGGYIAAMSSAYRKEGQKSEADFTAARDALFTAIAQGYPLPPDLQPDDRAVLATTCVNIIQTEKGTNPQQTKAAISILGAIKAADNAEVLVGLASDATYAVEAMAALGRIGYKPAIPMLSRQLAASTSAEVRKAALLATGEIGGAEGLDTILALLKPGSKDALPPDLTLAAAEALAGIAESGNGDQRVMNALKNFAVSDQGPVRSVAASGLGGFQSPAAVDALLPIVAGDKDPAVRKAAVIAVSHERGDAIMPAFLKLLQEKDLDPALELATIAAVGSNAQGALGIQVLVGDLAAPNPEIRSAASAALLRLYPANQLPVIGAVTRALTTSTDENLLAAGTALLASFADPTSLPTLLALLQKPQSEVKRNAAWALYRLRNGSNPRVSETLQQLVTNENVTIAARVNAVRALGIIGYDSATLNIWQTLVTTAQMRGDKYAMLRLFAVRALGEMGAGKPPVLQALAKIVARESDRDLRLEAVGALQALATPSQEAEDALAGAFALSSDDLELRLRIVETLADMGAARSVDEGAELLTQQLSTDQRRRLVLALSETPNEASANAILDASKDPAVADYAEAVLEGFPRAVIQPIVSRRLKLEADKGVLAVLGDLNSRFSD